MPVAPWSVKGVDPEAREAAKIAARRAGLTVGQWLSQTIRNAATEQLRNGGRPAATDTSRFGDMTAGDGIGQFGGYSAQPPAPTMQALFESIQKLASRIDATEMKTTAAIAPLADQVDRLSKQVEDVAARTGLSTAPVERAVMKLSERLQKIEEQSKQNTSRGSRWSLFGFSR